jgi:hypothetical protein
MLPLPRDSWVKAIMDRATITRFWFSRFAITVCIARLPYLVMNTPEVMALPLARRKERGRGAIPHFVTKRTAVGLPDHFFSSGSFIAYNFNP